MPDTRLLHAAPILDQIHVTPLSLVVQITVTLQPDEPILETIAVQQDAPAAAVQL